MTQVTKIVGTLPAKWMLPVVSIWVVLLAMVCTGCNKAPISNELLIYVCDAPADYDRVTFTVESVAIRAVGSQEWIPMSVDNPNVSLLTLTAGQMQKISSAKLACGQYDALRISFDPTNAKVIIGKAEHPMQMAPEPLVINLPQAITIQGEKQTLLLDFDAAASVVEKNVEPAIEYSFVAAVRVIEFDNIGSVQGGVTFDKGAAVGHALLVTFTPLDTEGADAKTQTYSTYTALKGPFFIRLAPGVYTMTIYSPSARPLNPWSQQVTVTKAEVTDLGLIVVTAISNP